LYDDDCGPCEKPSKASWRNDKLRELVRETMVEFYTTHAKKMMNSGSNKNKKSNVIIMKNVFSTTEEYFEGI